MARKSGHEQPEALLSNPTMKEPNYRDHRIYMGHLFRVLHKRGASSPADVYDEVADRAGITPEQRAVGGGEGSWPVYRNRIQFARQALIDAGTIKGPSEPGWRRGVWELSPDGEALATSGKSDSQVVERLKEQAAEGLRKRVQERKESRALAGLEPEEESEPTESSREPTREEVHEEAELSIEALVDAANDAVLSTMLEHVRSMNDRAFEHLVGAVLKAALRAESVTITQQSRDGGLDGILHLDTLGMRLAVFEAKRYAEGNVVSRSQLDAFATAARRRRASHSLFVTSSRFSPEAVQTAKDEGIRLIEGTALVALMARHGIGLRAKDTFVLYEIDPAWAVHDAESGGQ